MKYYIFGQEKQLDQLAISLKNVSDILIRVAEGTDISQLVTVCYFLPGIHQTRGVYIRQWANADSFRTKRGNWAFTNHFPVPDSLPKIFRLIRMRLDGRGQEFPREELDGYGWCFKYYRFEDQLATLFAHELHHYRRYHLNLHFREGEHGANRWALSHVQALGFRVSARKMDKKRRPQPKKSISLFGRDPYKNFRHLSAGDPLMIQKDPHHVYTNQIVHVVRPIRRNSKRIIIETADGKQWRWPMHWLVNKNE
ncbi:hypothetical protein JW835_08675 [bacterium]|nr:hypothetical protein [bacterium]